MKNFQVNHNKNVHNTQNLTKGLFIIYLMVLTWVLVFKLGTRFSYMDKRSFNLIPFRDFIFQNTTPDLPETILNVLIFVPFGIYTFFLAKRKSLKSTIMIVFLASFFIELIQFVLAIGAFDITDILTNTFGGLLGLAMVKFLGKIIKNKAKTQKIINILALIATILIVSLLVLLKLKMLPIRYQ